MWKNKWPKNPDFCSESMNWNWWSSILVHKTHYQEFTPIKTYLKITKWLHLHLLSHILPHYDSFRYKSMNILLNLLWMILPWVFPIIRKHEVRETAVRCMSTVLPLLLDFWYLFIYSVNFNCQKAKRYKIKYHTLIRF